jgi:hypothetical protein
MAPGRRKILPGKVKWTIAALRASFRALSENARTGANSGGAAMDYGRHARDGAGTDASGAIRVGVKAGPDAAEARWGLALTVFLRLVSLLWIVQALEQWRRIVAPVSGSFLDLSPSAMSATIFFAVLNPVAAVGLWLIAPWGGVVWLLTLFAQVFVIVVKPSFFLFGGALKLVDGVLLAIYLFLSWRANSASDETVTLDRMIARARELAVGLWRKIDVSSK